MSFGPIVLAGSSRSGWSFGELKGWWGQSPDKTEVRERPFAHGAFPSRSSVRASRLISFQANYISDDQSAIEDAFDWLASVGDEAPVLMEISTPAGSSWRVVKVENVEPVNYRAGLGFGRAMVDVTAEDPRRYATGTWQIANPATAGAGVTWPLKWPLKWPGGGDSGRIRLENTGRAPSAPTFRLLGGFSSATITCIEDGTRVGLDRPVPAGSVVEIDYAARTAVMDGTSTVSRWLRHREWSEVPKEAARTYQFDAVASSGALMHGKVDSAWW
ncbi:hypothetical protein [Microbacterium binotii]